MHLLATLMHEVV